LMYDDKGFFPSSSSIGIAWMTFTNSDNATAWKRCYGEPWCSSLRIWQICLIAPSMVVYKKRSQTGAIFTFCLNFHNPFFAWLITSLASKKVLHFLLLW
jgi:hypothetical protein